MTDDSPPLAGDGLIPLDEIRALAEKYGSSCVVVFASHPDGGGFSVTSYGDKRDVRDAAREMGENILRVLNRPAVEALAAELEELDEEFEQEEAGWREGMEKAWTRAADAHPEPHARYVVRRQEIEFTATPCYGMHGPWWVPRVPSRGINGWSEMDPIPIHPDDEWRALGSRHRGGG